MVTRNRNRDVAHFLVMIRDWAAYRPEIEAVALAGSWAHGDARMDSDLDLIVLCGDLDAMLNDIAAFDELGDGHLQYLVTRHWGPLTELRFLHPEGLEIELGFASTAWASTDPVDEGTRPVVEDGIAVLYDPRRILARLIRACQDA